MALLQGQEFDNLFRTFHHTAFHLELRDSYHIAEEAGPFELFMKGQPDDFSWHQPWLGLVREATRAGKSITRVRVVTVPHCDYTRWGVSVAPLNIEAGEDLRWLPRHRATGIDFPPLDYWLFDDNRVVLTIFADDGRFAGGVEVSDAELIEQCRKVHQQVWALAILHEQYVSG
ncbi:MAG: DUF6879 family protein [Pseudonocardiaceae bacterium]